MGLSRLIYPSFIQLFLTFCAFSTFSALKTSQKGGGTYEGLPIFKAYISAYSEVSLTK